MFGAFQVGHVGVVSQIRQHGIAPVGDVGRRAFAPETDLGPNAAVVYKLGHCRGLCLREGPRRIAVEHIVPCIDGAAEVGRQPFLRAIGHSAQQVLVGAGAPDGPTVVTHHLSHGHRHAARHAMPARRQRGAKAVERLSLGPLAREQGPHLGSHTPALHQPIGINVADHATLQGRIGGLQPPPQPAGHGAGKALARIAEHGRRAVVVGHYGKAAPAAHSHHSEVARRIQRLYTPGGSRARWLRVKTQHSRRGGALLFNGALCCIGPGHSSKHNNGSKQSVHNFNLILELNTCNRLRFASLIIFPACVRPPNCMS